MKDDGSCVDKDPERETVANLADREEVIRAGSDDETAALGAPIKRGLADAIRVGSDAEMAAEGFSAKRPV
jgi:hypothetical protein